MTFDDRNFRSSYYYSLRTSQTVVNCSNDLFLLLLIKIIKNIQKKPRRYILKFKVSSRKKNRGSRCSAVPRHSSLLPAALGRQISALERPPAHRQSANRTARTHHDAKSKQILILIDTEIRCVYGNKL